MGPLHYHHRDSSAPRLATRISMCDPPLQANSPLEVLGKEVENASECLETMSPPDKQPGLSVARSAEVRPGGTG